MIDYSYAEDIKDRPAAIKFEKRPVENKRKTLESGHVSYDDIDFVLVKQIGSRDVAELKAEKFLENMSGEAKRGRIPESHFNFYKKSYEAFKSKQELPTNGTPVNNWSAITPAQVANVLSIGIKSIEDLAAMGDEGVSRLGREGLKLKQLAKNYLNSSNSLAIKVTELEKELNTANKTIASLEEKIIMLSSDNNVSRGTYDLETELSAALQTEDEPETVESFQTEKPSIREAYKAKYGKYPHHRMKEETIRAKL